MFKLAQSSAQCSGALVVAFHPGKRSETNLYVLLDFAIKKAQGLLCKAYGHFHHFF